MLRWLCMTRHSLSFSLGSVYVFSITDCRSYILFCVIACSPATRIERERTNERETGWGYTNRLLYPRYINLLCVSPIRFRIAVTPSTETERPNEFRWYFPKADAAKQYSNCCRQVKTYMNHIQCVISTSFYCFSISLSTSYRLEFLVRTLFIFGQLKERCVHKTIIKNKSTLT